jgi:hypothetical protein
MADGLHILTRFVTKKPLLIALSGAGRGLRGSWWGRSNISLFGIVTMNPPCTTNIS